ncbi:LOW QUALITY PROTEIN: nicastrin [Rhinichthys klamathensis goyatoka]|uniref:LOW QUALITY PROTEIN: nicastrin n=1 Tax=Rhinichthys klamathensis goyatoka TaxID=3034132 RepID=UPI0024B4DF51|nr:LOW QUALITY PROTEIN: nicastrin [Rhinichthys klamathensis goyatoka]
MRKMEDLISINCVKLLIIALFYTCVRCSSVEQKIYVELNDTVPCVRLLNATHQIGCQSSMSGDTGVLHVLESEEDLDWILNTGPHPPYMIVMETAFFNRSVMLRMKNSSRVSGVAVIVSKTGLAENFSPHTTCPNQNTGVYSADYGPELANCNGTSWNPLGNGLSYEDFSFPVFALKDENQTQVIRKCYEDHNLRVNGSAPQYPLCAMQLFSHMHAVTDTVTCMRRTDLQNRFSINPEVLCDPLSDFNVWSSTRPLNSSAKGHKPNESVVIAATRLDGRSFFWDEAPAAEGTVSGIVTLLAAVHALQPVTQEAPPPRNIFFTFFQGEAFDYIGSSRMVYDMQRNEFVIDFDNVHSMLEIGQVGLRSGRELWMHSDPVSLRNSSVKDKVSEMMKSMQSIAAGLRISLDEPPVTQPLPPSSLQRFLRVRPIPGLVLADHQSSFINRYYESVYDDAENLNISYPPNLSPDEQLVFETEEAKSLAEVATLVARSLYKQAGGEERNLNNITTDPKIVAQLLYGFLIQKNNSWFRSLLPPEVTKKGANSILSSGPPQFYIGVGPRNIGPVHSVTRFVQYIMANLTGSVTNLTETQCLSPESKDLFSYFWVSGPWVNSSGEPFCVRASVRLAKAVSPAFERMEYGSRNYSTWTESRWKSIRARVFLVASRELEMLTLGVGVAVLLLSLLVTYFISSKAELLFSSARETPTTTY